VQLLLWIILPLALVLVVLSLFSISRHRDAMTPKGDGRPATSASWRPGVRRLRGLRVQLLLWIILPLALVLVVLSLFSISRHRDAMTQLVEDRNRGLALGEANRLAREIESRSAALTQAASTEPATVSDLPADLFARFPSGIALMGADGRVLDASGIGHAWTTTQEARVLAARSAAVSGAQFESHFSDVTQPHLLVGAQVREGVALLGAVPAAGLGLTESGGLIQTETNGAALVLDGTGRTLFATGDSGLRIDGIADLPPAEAGAPGASRMKSGQDNLLVTYAAVQPPGWTLAVVEDLHSVDRMGVSAVELLPLALLFIAVLALLALSFGAANIVRPLQELDRRARRVAWGDFDAVNEPVGGVQEVDELRATLAQMAERIRSYQSGMRDYLSAVTQAQEAERERLAHDLHDDTVQALIALRQRAQMARKSLGGDAPDPTRAQGRLDELTSLIDVELTNLRRLIGDLRPIYLEDLGFVPALEMLAQQTEARCGLAVRLDVKGQTQRLAPDLELAAYRIVQQALANAAAHAAARQATLTVEFGERELRLAVRDDGRGFTPPDQPADLARDGHFGLMGMRERALLYGGKLTIESAPGQGTTICASLPLVSGGSHAER
jgi:signal transduction histidine kinase